MSIDNARCKQISKCSFSVSFAILFILLTFLKTFLSKEFGFNAFISDLVDEINLCNLTFCPHTTKKYI